MDHSQRQSAAAAAAASRGSFGGCPLHQYAKNKEWDSLMREAHQSPTQLRFRNEFLDTPFHLAVRGGAETAILLELLELEPKVLKMKNQDGLLPLHIGCEYGLSLETLIAFLKLAPDTINWANNQNQTPLQVAESSTIFYIGTPTWHIYPEDYTKVVAALKQPQLIDVLYKAQVSTGTAALNLDRAMMAKAKSQGVFMAIPVDPPPGH